MGDERYRVITRQYYTDTHGILLVNYISSRDSFDNILVLEKEMLDNTPADSVLTVVGNKTYLIKERVVSYQEGKNKAEDLGNIFTKVCEKSGDNIHLLFKKISEAMMQCILNRHSFKESKSTTNLISDFREGVKKEEKKGWCMLIIEKGQMHLEKVLYYLLIEWKIISFFKIFFILEEIRNLLKIL